MQNLQNNNRINNHNSGKIEKYKLLQHKKIHTSNNKTDAPHSLGQQSPYILIKYYNDKTQYISISKNQSNKMLKLWKPSDKGNKFQKLQKHDKLYAKSLFDYNRIDSVEFYNCNSQNIAISKIHLKAINSLNHLSSLNKIKFDKCNNNFIACVLEYVEKNASTNQVKKFIDKSCVKLKALFSICDKNNTFTLDFDLTKQKLAFHAIQLQEALANVDRYAIITKILGTPPAIEQYCCIENSNQIIKVDYDVIREGLYGMGRISTTEKNLTNASTKSITLILPINLAALVLDCKYMDLGYFVDCLGFISQSHSLKKLTLCNVDSAYWSVKTLDQILQSIGKLKKLQAFALTHDDSPNTSTTLDAHKQSLQALYLDLPTHLPDQDKITTQILKFVETQLMLNQIAINIPMQDAANYLAKLHNLTKLELLGSSVSQSIDSLKSFANLQKLTLSGTLIPAQNQTKEKFAKQICQLSQLTDLTLEVFYGKCIFGVTQNIIETMKLLKSLSVDNSFMNQDPCSVSEFCKLIEFIADKINKQFDLPKLKIQNGAIVSNNKVDLEQQQRDNDFIKMIDVILNAKLYSISLLETLVGHDVAKYIELQHGEQIAVGDKVIGGYSLIIDMIVGAN